MAGTTEPAVPYQVTTADANAVTGKGRLTALCVCPTGAVTPTITIYDNTAASGTILWGPHKIPSGTAVPVVLGDAGVNFTLGVFVHSDSWTTLAVNIYAKRP